MGIVGYDLGCLPTKRRQEFRRRSRKLFENHRTNIDRWFVEFGYHMGVQQKSLVHKVIRNEFVYSYSRIICMGVQRMSTRTTAVFSRLQQQ